MNKSKGRYQGTGMCDRGCRFTILNLLFTIVLLLFSSPVTFAACTASIIASTPTADFVNHGNGTVTHTKTGLMWKQCSEGLSGVGCATGAATFHTWQAALQLAEALNAGGGFVGFADWRVPNIKELNSIVERQCNTPAINVTIFPATVSSLYWSASLSGTGSVSAIHFSGGGYFANNKNNNHYVRLVRGGQ